MFNYIIRRIIYSLPIILGVNLITFLLFFIVNTPDDIARRILGEKRITKEAIEKWKKDRDYHLPVFLNQKESGVKKISQTIFYRKSLSLLVFNFGKSDRNNLDITREIKKRIIPSLLITLPSFTAGLFLYILISLLVVYYRNSFFDKFMLLSCVVMMSLSSLFYIISFQFVFGKYLLLFPISGFEPGIDSLRFIFLPVLVAIFINLGSEIRFYRTIFLEEYTRDYVITARAKGLSEGKVLFKHILKNASIPILTDAVMNIPFLFMGSLLLESFFSIPGLGSFTIDAIGSEDFAIVRGMVYIGALLYIAGSILTDVAYSVFDPRIKYE